MAEKKRSAKKPLIVVQPNDDGGFEALLDVTSTAFELDTPDGGTIQGIGPSPEAAVSAALLELGRIALRAF